MSCGWQCHFVFPEFPSLGITVSPCGAPPTCPPGLPITVPTPSNQVPPLPSADTLDKPQSVLSLLLPPSLLCWSLPNLLPSSSPGTPSTYVSFHNLTPSLGFLANSRLALPINTYQYVSIPIHVFHKTRAPCLSQDPHLGLILLPGGAGDIWEHLWLSQLGVLLAWSGWGSEVLISAPQCPGCPEHRLCPEGES